MCHNTLTVPVLGPVVATCRLPRWSGGRVPWWLRAVDHGGCGPVPWWLRAVTMVAAGRYLGGRWPVLWRPRAGTMVAACRYHGGRWPVLWWLRAVHHGCGGLVPWWLRAGTMVAAGRYYGGCVPVPWWPRAGTMVAAGRYHGGRGPGPWWLCAGTMVAECGLQCGHKASSTSRPYVPYVRCGAMPSLRLWPPTVLSSAWALHLLRVVQCHDIAPEVATYSAAISACEKGPAAPAGLTSLTSDAAPCHRAGCDRLQYRRQHVQASTLCITAVVRSKAL